MTTLRPRRLTAARAARLRRAYVDYSMRRPADRGSLGDITLKGEQSWLAVAREYDRDDDIARIGVHRVPLHTGQDVGLLTDAGDDVPGSPVSAVIGSSWEPGFDALLPKVVRRMPNPEAADDPRATFLVVEPVNLHPDWIGLGAGELLLSIVLAELRSERDTVAVAEPVEWFLKGRPRTEARSIQMPIFQNIGFQPYKRGMFALLTDWVAFENAHEAYMRRFGVLLSPEPT